MLKLSIFISIFIISLSVSKVSCSLGDHSPFYQKCISKCYYNNCTSDKQYKPELAKYQDFWDWLLWWNCGDECRYDCMWVAVEGFQMNNFDIPKFHGKWPFKKILGMQEPASTLGSLLNLLGYAWMYGKMKREFPINHSFMASFWHLFSWVCMSAWFWSAAFHARDVPFTEFMDYTGAFTMVMFHLIAALVRFTHEKSILPSLVSSSVMMVFYVDHVLYLAKGNTDYGYNMAVNIYVGMVGSFLWLVWSFQQYLRLCYHVLFLVVHILLTAGTVFFETLDFAPIYGWDAHAVWHLQTSILPHIFYRFVIIDLRYLAARRFYKLA